MVKLSLRMMICSRIILLLLILSSNLHGQEVSKTYYDEYGFPCDATDAKWYRVVSEHPEYPEKFLVKDYYLNDALKRLATYVDEDIFEGEGLFIHFYPNGQKKEEGFYKDNFNRGKLTKWYYNGQLKEEGIYIDEKNFLKRYKVENFWDSLGTQLATNGNGEYVVEEEVNAAYARGPLQNGYKNEKWTGYFENGAIAFEEQYEDNKLIKGVSFDTDGKRYVYETLYESNVMESFYNYIMKNMKYPVQARKAGIEGKVMVQLLFNAEGRVLNARVAKGIDQELDAEAVRVVKQYYGKWKPMKKRGQKYSPKPQTMILPITFKLG